MSAYTVTYKKTFSKNVKRCGDGSTHVTVCSMVVLIYTVCHVLYQAAVELPSIPIVFIALVIKLELFMLQLTCEKDVGMGLCMFNFVILLSLHLVSVLFGTSIPTSFFIF